MDFVFPNNNEEEFAKTAKKLSIDNLVFVYTDIKMVKKMEGVKTALLASPKQVNSAKRFVDFVIVKSGEDDRFALEKSKPDFMFGFEFAGRKDFMHQRASGLNQVLCKIAKKNNIKILFPFSDLLKQLPENKSVIIGRLIQNIKLCRKYGVSLSICSFAKTPFEMRKMKDLESFVRILN
ncbi:hypothetical protein HZA97_09940 [Candidatus Woesearchaeota archaeon]|nr:hypothetical protein [Candidatus Woesearchaeota archaeon]